MPFLSLCTGSLTPQESINEIQERYIEINSHAKSYTWKAMLANGGSFAFGELDMTRVRGAKVSAEWPHSLACACQLMPAPQP